MTTSLEKSSTCADSPPIWKRIRPEEYLFAAFGLSLAAVVSFSRRLGWGDLWTQVIWRVENYVGSKEALPLLLAVGCVFPLALVWSIRNGRGKRIGGIVRDAAPFLLAYLSYVLLRDLIPLLRPTLMDDSLAAMETAVLGVPTFVAIPRALGCAALDLVLMACYVSHYWIPPAFAIFLAWRDRDQFRRFMLALTIIWALGYIGYLLVPAIGPKYFFSNYATWRTSAGIRPILATIESFAGVTRDCFPSQHVAWTVLTLWAARRYRIFFRIYLPIAAGLTLATIYFGFHYLVDVPAGVLLAVVSIGAAGRLHDWWRRPVSAILIPCASAPSASGSPPVSASS